MAITLKMTDTVRETRGHNVTYEGRLPSEKDYKQMLTVLAMDKNGKQYTLRIPDTEAAKIRACDRHNVLKILGVGKMLEK